MVQRNEDVGLQETNMETQKRSTINLQSIFMAVLKRPWIPIFTVLLIAVPAAFYFLSSVRLYRSEAEVMVPVQENSFTGMNFVGGGSEPAKPTHYYTSILNSDNYQRAVAEKIQKMGLDVSPRQVESQLHHGTDPREPGLFSIYSLTPEENIAQELVEVGIKEFRDRIIGLEQQEARAVLQFINEQLEELNAKTIKAEDELQTFLREQKLVIEDRELGIAQQMTKLENQLAESEMNLRLIQLDIQSTQQQVEAMLENDSQNQTTDKQGQIRELEDKRDDINARLQALRSDTNAPVATIDSLEALSRSVSAELLRLMSNSYSPSDETQMISLSNLQTILEDLLVERKKARNRVSFFEAKVNSFLDQHPNISEEILEYAMLQRQRDVLTQTLSILLEKREEAQIKMASQLGGLKVLEDPTEAEPQARNTIRRMIVVLLLSGLFGLGLAVAVDMIRQTIDAEPDITEHFAFPLLGVIPRLDQKSVQKQRKKLGDRKNELSHSDARLISDFSTKSWFTEAIRSIRTSLLFQSQEKNARVLAVTSPMPFEGKTLTTANLAILLQRGGRKTLIIDADLRRPRLHRQFDRPRKPGMADFLLDDEAQVTLDSVIQPTHEKNLWIITAGMSSHDPSELINSRKMKKTLDLLKERFDFIIIDTSPVLPAVDSRLLGGIVDGMIMVARAEQTKFRSFQSAIDLLQSLDITILGAILNHADRKYNQLYYYSYGRYHAYYQYYYRPYTYYGTAYGETEEVTNPNISRAWFRRRS